MDRVTGWYRDLFVCPRFLFSLRTTDPRLRPLKSPYEQGSLTNLGKDSWIKDYNVTTDKGIPFLTNGLQTGFFFFPGILINISDLFRKVTMCFLEGKSHTRTVTPVSLTNHDHRKGRHFVLLVPTNHRLWKCWGRGEERNCSRSLYVTKWHFGHYSNGGSMFLFGQGLV